MNVEVDVAPEVEDDLTYLWSVPDGWELLDDDEPVVDLVAHEQWGRTATIEVEVVDRYDQSDSGEVTISTHEVDGPQITSVDAEPEAVGPEGEKTVEVGVDHPQDLEVDHEWDVPEDWSELEDRGEAIDLEAPDEHDRSDTIEVTVIDTEDNEATASGTVSTRENPGPTIEKLAADDPFMKPEATTEVSVDATHELDHELVHYDWSIDPDDAWSVESDDDDPHLATVTAPDEYEAEAVLTIEVIDEYGGLTEAQLDVVTKAEDNEPPFIEELYAEDNPVEAGETTDVHVEAEDPMGYELSYDWSIDSDDDWELEVDDNDETIAQLEAPDEYESTVDVTVEVVDEFGESVDETIEVATKTEQNEPPVVDELTVEETPILPGQSTQVVVEATDPFGQQLTYDWEVDDGDWTVEVEGDDPAVATVTAPDEVGVSSDVTVTVEDEDEQSVEATETVDTITNQGPTVGAESEGDGVVDPGETIGVSATVDHPHGFEVDYHWTIESDDSEDGWQIMDGADAEVVTVQAPEESGTKATVEVAVTDDYGGEETGDATLESIVNDGPNLESVDVTGDEVVDPGEETTVEVDANHPQNYELSYSWTVTGDDSEDGWQITDGADSEEVTLQAPGEAGTAADVEVTVTDDYGGQETGDATVETTANDGPDLESVDVTGEEVVDPGEEATVEADASHPQGFELHYSWEIISDDSEDGWEIIEGAGSDEVTLKAPDEPETSATVEVVVTDDYGGEDSGDEDVATEQNDGPSIDDHPWADPDPVAPNEMTDVQVNASHPQGYELSYDWEALEDGWTTIGEGDSVELDPIHAPEQNSVVEVTVSDPYDESETVDTTVSTKENEDPEIEGFDGDEEIFDLDPDDEDVNRTRDVTVNASDEYDFELSYDWSIEGDGWTILEENDETVTVESPHEPNSSATLNVEVTDDYDGFDEASTTLETLENSDPEITDVWTVDSPPFEREEWFEMNILAGDPDGGELSYEWTTDGEWDIFGQYVEEPDVQAPDQTEFENILLTVEDEWGYEDTYDVDVHTYDYIPDDFAFDNESGVEPEVVVESNEIEITGLDEEISVEAACYYECQLRHDQGLGDWTDWSSTQDGIEEGTMVQIRKESDVYAQTAEANLEVGETVSDPWELTTRDWKGARTFSNCGQTGRLGPSQDLCDDAYDGSLLEDKVSVDDGIQTWEVPATGIYELEAQGAEGDSSTSGTDARSLGARSQGNVALDKGEEIQVLVGQQGEYDSSDGHAASGGGGTFVATGGDEPLVVAGGGGGIIRHEHPNRHGHDETHGKDGIHWNDSTTSGGEDGDGGYPDRYDTDGGAGFYGNCQDDSTMSFLNGGAGGDSDADGGFGGGGSARASCCSEYGRCGGGGGYSGGGGVRQSQWDDQSCTGGGGGSFVSEDAESEEFETGVNTGHGSVNIDWVGPQSQ